MKKEEIIDMFESKDIRDEVRECFKQEAKNVAIEFEIWKLSEGWLPEESIGVLRKTVYRSMNHNLQPTLEELFELFLQRKK